MAPLFARYRDALVREPRMRRYLVATLVDDVGIAGTAWASMLLLANLLTDQRQRAKVMVPTLLCFLVGNVLGGPIADWAESRGAAALAAWRHRVVVATRALETLALGALVVVLASGPPSLAKVAPYMMVTAFMKTALRPTRVAFEVDLLEESVPQLDEDGHPMLDEHGRPRMLKPHLLPYGALIGALRSAAALVGVLLGGAIVRAAHQRYWLIFSFDVLTNVVFLVIVARACRPAIAADATEPSVARPRPSVFGDFFGSLRDGLRFLFAPAQRPLLALLFGSMLVEWVSEAYDGKMIVKQVLRGSDDDLRHAYLAWLAVSIVPVLALPTLARSLGNLSRVFLALMIVDGAVIAVAGRLAHPGASITAFALVLGVDHALTTSATSLVDLAANSASGAGMRGRIAATYAFFVLLGDLVMQIAAAAWSEAVGLGPMIVRLGLAQIAVVAVLAALGGRRLWSFGLREAAPREADPDALAVPTGG